MDYAVPREPGVLKTQGYTSHPKQLSQYVKLWFCVGRPQSPCCCGVRPWREATIQSYTRVLLPGSSNTLITPWASRRVFCNSSGGWSLERTTCYPRLWTNHFISEESSVGLELSGGRSTRVFYWSKMYHTQRNVWYINFDVKYIKTFLSKRSKVFALK